MAWRGVLEHTWYLEKNHDDGVWENTLFCFYLTDSHTLVLRLRAMVD